MAVTKMINNGHGVTGQEYVNMRVTFYTENGELIVTGRSDNQLAAQKGLYMQSNLLSVKTKNDNNDDMPSFSILLTGGEAYNKVESWEDYVKPNDYVKIDVVYTNDQAPISSSTGNTVENYNTYSTLISGLVSDINLSGQYENNQQMYTITCQGVAKILDNIQLSTFSELVTSLSNYVLLPDDESQGIAFQGNNSRNIIAQVLERFIFNTNGYTDYEFIQSNGSVFANAQNIINKFNYDATKTKSEISGNTDEKMMAMPTKYMNYNGSLLSLIKDLANKPFNELYWTHEEGIATLHHRFTPFDPDRWNKLEILHVDNSTIISQNIDQTDTEQYAIFKMTTDSNTVTSSTLSSFLYPLTNTSLIKMWGYKMMDINNDYFVPVVDTSSSNDSDSEGDLSTAGSGKNITNGDNSGDENYKKAWNYLTSVGVSKKGAAAIMGNITQESHFKPDADNGGNYHGIAQWDTSSRYANLKNWTKKKGLSANSFSGQIQFLVHEMKTTTPTVWKAVTGDGSVADITEKVTRYYERAVNKNGTLQALSERQDFAKAWYASMKNQSGKKDNTNKSIDFIEKSQSKIKQDKDTKDTKQSKGKSQATSEKATQALVAKRKKEAETTSNVATNHVSPSYDYVNAILSATANDDKVDKKMISSKYGGISTYNQVEKALKEGKANDINAEAQTLYNSIKDVNPFATKSSVASLINSFNNANQKLTPEMYRIYLLPTQEYYQQGLLPTLESPMDKFAQARKHPNKDAKLLLKYTNNNLGQEQAVQIIKKWIKNKGSLSEDEYNTILKEVAYSKTNSKVSTEGTSQSAYDMIIKYTRKLFNWYADNAKYFSGTITVQGTTGVEIGKRLQFIDEETGKLWDFYIEDVEQNYDLDTGWTTTIGITRGLKLSSASDNLRFSMMYGKYQDFVGGYFGEPTLSTAINTANTSDSDSEDTDDGTEGDVSSLNSDLVNKAIKYANKLAEKSTYYSQAQHAVDPFGAGRRGTDCSGSVYWVYRHAGYNWSKHNITPTNSSTRQLDKSWATNQVTPIGTSKAEAMKKAKAGDLFFYTFAGAPVNGHVTIYLGNGKWMSSDQAWNNGVGGVKIWGYSHLGNGFRGHVRRLK